MNPTIIPMDLAAARLIAYWDFGEGYRFYNIEGDEETINEFLNGHYYQLILDDEMIGFFCDGEMARLDVDYPVIYGTIDIGFALRPDLTSKGLGSAFLSAITDYYIKRDHPTAFRLTVASFNRRAIKLYLKFGFRMTDHFAVEDDGESIHFDVMQYDVS